jgi:hypothetical protein
MAHTVDLERRAGPRFVMSTNSRASRVRLRPGRTAQVLNLSRGGALIETDWRLMPGARADVQIGDAAAALVVSGRIVRCHVALLERSRVRYRAALAFDQQLPVWELTTPAGSGDREVSEPSGGI